jgi:phenylpropionate dioxygenase-like ring-hydroxylating dioxygenase large terminal subunit
MAVLDHWHPVYPSRSLGRRPVQVVLADTPIALFRTASGDVGALIDECPHRRMRLSLGQVVDENLRCQYHGWTFDCAGQGQSPGTPRLHACAEAFTTRESRGYIWLKSRESQPEFPLFDTAGFFPIARLEHRCPAGLEVTLDNFTEIEHTPTTHGLFGYALERMHEVTVHFETTPGSVRVINSGPPKPLPFWHRWLLGVRRGDVFHDIWTTYFSPVYSVYDHWWSAPGGGRQSRVRWRLYMFFTPVHDLETRVTTFAYAHSTWPGWAGGLRLFRWLLRRKLDAEIRLDVKILSGLANYDESLTGMKLSRFDRALGLNRERIARVYRGHGLRVLAA